jgi:hypothetical protein
MDQTVTNLQELVRELNTLGPLDRNTLQLTEVLLRMALDVKRSLNTFDERQDHVLTWVQRMERMHRLGSGQSEFPPGWTAASSLPSDMSPNLLESEEDEEELAV